LNSRGDICAFSGARGIVTILEKKGCEHVKSLAQSEAALSSEDTGAGLIKFNGIQLNTHYFDKNNIYI
jgi:hypothetical protein